MKKIWAYGLLVLLISSVSHAQANLEKLVAQEKQAWEAFKNKDAKFMISLLRKDFTEVGFDGAVLNRSGVIQAMYEYDITDVQSSDFKLLPVDNNAALLLYKVATKATHKGQPLPDLTMQASTLYVLTGGKWLVKFHQETPLAPSPQTQTAPAR